MRKMVWRYCAVFVLVILTGGLLMQVSQAVQKTERDIRHYDRKIAREQENIRVLRAEWAYLNNPARLEYLVSGDMDLSPVETDVMLSDLTTLPELPEDSVSSPPVSFQPDIRQGVAFEPSKPLSSKKSNNQSPIFIRATMRESGGE